jgi:RND family efflux transporter MFP subunit
LVAEDPLKLRGDVPERFAHELQVDQTVQVHVDAFQDAVFTGRLARISPASNPENRSVAVEAVVDNRERKLKPGFFANAAVVTRTDDRALMVPQEALITFAGVTKLFVIKDGVAHERQVQTGTRGSGGLIEITAGLAPDEQVATSGLTKLENGIAVTVKEPAAPAPAAPPAS